jgi:16S rRNA (guanine527-N7)-methyltransferase
VVSRETGPPAPAEARGVFGVRLPLAEHFAALLATDGVERGLIGPRETPRLWDRHLLNCAVLEELVPARATVADLGAGAGLPGLVLALARPDLEVTLVEPLLRRTTFLEEVVAELQLERVRVHRGRAESLHGAARFDVVTSRALAPLDRLLDWSMPLVAPSGAMVALKGRTVTEEIESTRDQWERLGCAEPEVVVVGEGRVSSPGQAVRVAWRDSASVSWPAAPSVEGRRNPHRDGGARAGKRRHRRGR